MKICYISYYPSKNYPRQIQFIDALKDFEGNSILIINSRKGILGYLEILGKYIKTRIKYDFGTLVLGFRTTEIFFLLYLLSPGKRIIYDCFVPLYPALKHENKWKLNKIVRNLLAPLAYVYEKLQVNLSDLIITDTISHSDLIHKLYKPKGHVKSVYLGNPISTWLHKNSKPSPSRKFKVFYYGTGQQLHGTQYIIEAMKELSDTSDIQCTIIGKIPADLNTLITNTKTISYYTWKDKKWLLEEALDSDLCLGGPFGNTFQSQNVITGKTFQFLSLAKCTLVGANFETRRFGFKDKVNCLIIDQGSKDAIINGIIWAFKNQDNLENIGNKGRILYEKHFSKMKLSNEIQTLVKSI